MVNTSQDTLATLLDDQRMSIRLLSLLEPTLSEAIDTLVELMRHGKDKRVRGTAAQALLDRGWGKPKQGEIADRGVWRTPRLSEGGFRQD